MKFNPSSKAITIFVAIVGVVVIYFVICGQSLDATRDYVLTNIKWLLVTAQIIAIAILLLLKKWIASAVLVVTVLVTILGVKG